MRWTQTVADLTVAVDNCIGDILISAGFISYLGPFTAEFRSSIGDSWRERKPGRRSARRRRRCKLSAAPLQHRAVTGAEYRGWLLALTAQCLAMPTTLLPLQLVLLADAQARNV